MTRLIPGVGLAAGLTATLFLSGCGGGGEEARAFKPLSYSYLTPLRLNVGEIRIEDHAPPPGPSDLAQGAPVPPEEALRRMAQDRLVAAGSSGTAVFSIDQAAITGDGSGGPLDGTLAVHLDIIGNNGGHSGYAEAHVSRQFVPGTGTDNDGLKAQLYNLTVQMMQNMNVEFEFQLRRTLADWMVDASGSPVGASVEQQPLGTPGQSAPPAPPSVGAPLQLAPPPDAVPGGAAPAPGSGLPPAGPTAVDPAAGTPLQLSPQPGFLQPPPGAAPGGFGPGYTGPGYTGQGYPGQTYPGQTGPGTAQPGRIDPSITPPGY